MSSLNIFQFVEVLRITGNNTGDSTVMTGVSTGRCSGTSWVDCPFQALGVYVNFDDSNGARQQVTTGISIVMGSNLGKQYSTVLIDEDLSSEEGLVYIPDSSLIIARGDYLLVNVGKTGPSQPGYGYATIHVGF